MASAPCCEADFCDPLAEGESDWMLPSAVAADMCWPAARSPGHSWRTGCVALCALSASSCTSLPCGVSVVAIGLMTVRGATKTEDGPAQPAGLAAVRCGCEYLSKTIPKRTNSYFRKRSGTEAVPTSPQTNDGTSVPSDLSGPEVAGHKAAVTPATSTKPIKREGTKPGPLCSGLCGPEKGEHGRDYALQNVRALFRLLPKDLPTCVVLRPGKSVVFCFPS